MSFKIFLTHNVQEKVLSDEKRPELSEVLPFTESGKKWGLRQTNTGHFFPTAECVSNSLLPSH